MKIKDKLSITKEDPLDTFNGYTSEQVEQEKRIEVVDSSNIRKVVTEFEEALKLDPIDDVIESKYILSENELNSFIQISKKYHSHKEFSIYLGTFLGSLVENLFKEKKSALYLDLIDLPPIDHFLSFFRPLNYSKYHTKNLYKITIDGSLGMHCFSNSNFIDVDVSKNVGIYFGVHSSNISVNVQGNVGSEFGLNSEFLRTRIKGSADKLFGDGSKYLSGIIEGDMDECLGNYSKGLNVRVDGSIHRYGLFYKAVSGNLQMNQAMFSDFESNPVIATKETFFNRTLNSLGLYPYNRAIHYDRILNKNKTLRLILY